MAFKMTGFSPFTKPDEKTTEKKESGSIVFPADDSEFWDTELTIAGGKAVSKAEYKAWMLADPSRWRGQKTQ